MRRALVTMTGAALCATGLLLGCGDSGGDTGGAGGSGSVTVVTVATSVTSTHATNTVGSTTTSAVGPTTASATTATTTATTATTTDATTTTGVSTSSASSSSTGTAVLCGDGVVGLGEGCDDGNTTDGDGCSATCAAETGYLCTGTPSVCTLGGTCASPLPITGNSFTFNVPSLDPFGDDNNFTDDSCEPTESDMGSHPDVVFQVALLAGQTIHVTDSGSADLLFHVVAGACDNATACAASYDGGNSSEASTGLTYVSTVAQSVYLVIDSWTDDPPPDANVALDVEITQCGDGVVSSDEECDDGGTTAGDGCSDTCAVELGFVCNGSPSVCAPVPAANCANPIVVTGNSFSYTGPNINSYGDDENYNSGATCKPVSSSPPHGSDITFRADLTAGQTVRVRELGSVDSLIHIIQPPLCVGGSACVASTDNNETVGVSYTASTTGPVYLVVEAWGSADAPDDAFNVAIDIASCGDGVVSGAETCDDGNTVGGDGCSATCSTETGFVCDGSVCSNISACTTATCALGTCTGMVVTGVASGTPAPIPDNVPAGGVMLSIPITATGTITKMAMHFDATHTFDADIDMFLTGPGGSELDISTDNGSSGDNYTGTLFRSGVSSSIASGTAPFTGVFAPETSLFGFNGQSVSGNWALRVADDASTDTGTVNAWDIAFCVTP